MNYGAVDIGSNAIRLFIGDIENEGKATKIIKQSLIRIPLRLGEEVFSEGTIPEQKQTDLIRSLEAFKLLLKVYKVDNFKACATSAMREAGNRDQVLQKIIQETGIDVEVITGQREAEFIFSTFFTLGMDKKETYLYIDVGGGSTEVSLLVNGKKVRSKSFKIGTVRILKNKVKKKHWKQLKEWAKEIADFHHPITAVGTGGNINKIFKLNKGKEDNVITYKEIKSTAQYLSSFSMKERINTLGLRPDRADVIIPASDIYLALMKNANVQRMIVPKIGLSDGIIYHLYKRERKSEKKNLKKEDNSL